MNGDVITARNDKASRMEKKTLLGAYFGFTVDMIDIYLPTVTLGPAMLFFLPKNLPAITITTIYYVTIMVTLLGRPLGAAIFGTFADKIGRKTATLYSTIGFTVATLLIAFLPGYQHVGYLAISLLLAFRFIDGVFLGGSYTAATPLAMEYAPKKKRGLYSATIQNGFATGFIAITVITAIMLKVAHLGDVNSPYVQWGWRIPFVFAAILSSLLYVYYVKQVDESKVWQVEKKVKMPLAEVLFGKDRRNFWQLFVMMSGAWLANAATNFAMPGLLLYNKMKASTLTDVLMGVTVLLAICYFAGGIISQKIGRRRLNVWSGVLTVILCPVLLYYTYYFSKTNLFLTTIFLTLLYAVPLAGLFAHSFAYINERFRTSVRGAGFAMGYSISVIIPSFYSFYMLGLKSIMPYEYTPLVLTTVGGILAVIGTLMGPETKDVDMGEVIPDLSSGVPEEILF